MGTPDAAAASLGSGLSPARFWEAIELEAARAQPLQGARESEISVFACEQECLPIPWQLDERKANGEWALDRGPEPEYDEEPGLLDSNDLILFMAADAGVRAGSSDDGPSLPPAVAAVEVEVGDPRTADRAWAYLLRFSVTAPRSPEAYVRYDPRADRLEGRRIVLGFNNGTPRFLQLTGAGRNDPANLLDRMKLRATARFLWGLIAVTRDEDDVQVLPVAWHEGPIRIVRRQRLWVRLAWWLRTPIFRADTYFYRDFGRLPVRLRLNFPPRVLFTDVEIRAALDFRDLRGWEVETPEDGGSVRRQRVTGHMVAQKEALSRQRGEWFALRGPSVRLVQMLALSPSLQSVQRRLFYREGPDIDDPPEYRLGEMPSAGYVLSRWGEVDSGRHRFTVHSYALPTTVDLHEFLDALSQPLHTEVRGWALPELR